MLQLLTYPAASLELSLRIDHLHKKCDNVLGAREAWKYVKPMIEIMKQHKGKGLAANQVGLDIPLFVIMIRGEIIPVYRPKITWTGDGVVRNPESCLSLPEHGVIPVDRFRTIEVDFIAQPNNKRGWAQLTGRDAAAFQHEFDHLNGITILDRYAGRGD